MRPGGQKAKADGPPRRSRPRKRPGPEAPAEHGAQGEDHEHEAGRPPGDIEHHSKDRFDRVILPAFWISGAAAIRESLPTSNPPERRSGVQGRRSHPGRPVVETIHLRFCTHLSRDTGRNTRKPSRAGRPSAPLCPPAGQKVFTVFCFQPCPAGREARPRSRSAALSTR